MTKTGKTIALAILGLTISIGIVLVGSAIWFFTSVLDTVVSDEAAATRSFGDVRARFNDSGPILQMTERGPVIARTPPAQLATRDLQSVRLLAWNRREERLASITLPFWVLRLKEGPINVAAESAVPNVRLSMTAEELERYGPAILLDHTDQDGSHVLIWTE